MLKIIKTWLFTTEIQRQINRLKSDRKRELRKLWNCPFPQLMIGLENRYNTELTLLKAKQLIEEQCNTPTTLKGII